MDAIIASAIPVFPDDGSIKVDPGLSNPCFSACNTIDLAIRSLTDPAGFWFSSLA